jgi:hypothetical protein
VAIFSAHFLNLAHSKTDSNAGKTNSRVGKERFTPTFDLKCGKFIAHPMQIKFPFFFTDPHISNGCLELQISKTLHFY